ncbi:hypothetical protein ACNOYE_17000 [Nannocystaceae bacterium ST9]
MTRIAATLLCLSLLGCPRDSTPDAGERSQPLTREDVPIATPADVPKLDTSAYARTLAEQFDLVPVDADALVIRDLRPLIDEARTLERVMAGPLARALPGLIQASGAGSGESQLATMQGQRETLALVLAGLESTGLSLERGAVISEIAGQPMIAFAAVDLDQLGAIANLAGLDLAAGCGPVPETPQWWVCSMAGAAGLAGYRPGRRGAEQVAELATALPGVEIERVNVAVRMRTSEASPPLNAVLRTDPGLWELSMPLPASDTASLLATGPAPALRSLLPGAGFVWGRWDPTQAKPMQGLALPLDLPTGEVFVGPLAEPSALVARAGITDASEAAKLVQQFAGMLPSKPIEPESMPGAKLEIDRKPIDLDGKLVPALGVTGSGAPVEAFEQALGLPLRGRVWAYGEYVSVGYGQLDELPAALERQRGEGPPAPTIAALPPTLARALLDRQVGLAIHFVLDPWQAPLSPTELADLFAGLPEAQRPDAASVGQAFAALAPWSSLSLWLQRHSADAPWIAHVSLVPFAAPGPGIDASELAASEAALATALTGGDAQAAYRDLLTRWPDSPRAAVWRARLGEAPDSFAAMGMLQLGIITLVGVPTLLEYVDRAKASEAIDETQAILAAALAVRERSGSCSGLIGAAGPTPALTLACHANEGGRCRPGDPGYPASAWTDDPLWATIAWQPKQGHRFHYAFEGREVEGECVLTVRAIGDLDGDGVVSTYSRSTTIAADGSQRSPPLQIEGEGE